MNTNEFKYGSVLKVTRYDTEKDIEKHFSLMRDCGMDTVVIWPAAFWWEEKKEGYPFNTGKMILRKAEKYGIKVIMELAGQLSVFEYIPDFMMKKEFHPTQKDGSREFGYNSFGYLSYFNPEVNELICKHFEKTANAYKDFPALIAYDVFNETMFNSYDKYTIEEFRGWLKEKYGSIEHLNEVWERTYSDWSQIEYEEWKWMSVAPEVDFGAFRKASIGRFLKKWCAAIKKIDTVHPLIADNIHSMVSPGCSYERPQDDLILKDVVDEIGMSFYPKQIRGTMENALRHEVFDSFYTASKRDGFYISEMQTHIQALYNPTTCVRPYELKRWCLEAYSAGAKGLIYWMWRPFNKGLQTMGRGLVDYKDRPTERYHLAKELSYTFERYGSLTPIKSKIGILFDPVCDDFTRCFARSYGLEEALYNSSIFGAYKAAFDLGVKADIITLEEVGNYEAVVLTNNLVIDDKRADIFKNYVKNGGKLIIDGRFGVINDESLINRDLPGGKMNELCGVDYLDSDYEQLDFTYNGAKINGYYMRDLVEVTTGEIKGRFDDGRCAVSRIKYGEGEAMTFNTMLWYGYAKTGDESILSLMSDIISEYGLTELKYKGDVTVKVAENSEKYLFFIFNYTDKEQKVEVSFRDITFDALIASNDSVIIEKDK